MARDLEYETISSAPTATARALREPRRPLRRHVNEATNLISPPHVTAWTCQWGVSTLKTNTPPGGTTAD